MLHLMGDRSALWGEVIQRLGLAAVGAVEDGLRYQVQTASASVELRYSALRLPISVRVVVKPVRHEGSFLIASSNMVPTTTRFRTGDAVFDDKVAVIAGGRVVLPRLGAPERELLVELVGKIGAIVGADEATLEPAVTARFTNAKEATDAIRHLMRIVGRLSVDPPVEELIDRWFQEDGAEMVTAAASRRVVELLPSVSEVEAETASRLLLERGGDIALTMLTAMPPYACVLSAWFKLGDPLDPRIVVRVVDAWRAGSPRPAARYLVWLLHRSGPDAEATALRLWQTPGLAEDGAFVREFVRSVRREPPPGAVSFLLQVQPRSSSLARRLAKALGCYPSAEVDRRLLEWLGASSGGVRSAAASTLADRVLVELDAGGRAERLEPVRRAAERSSELLMGLLDRVPASHTTWLVPIRPHGEPDAIALIRRLGQGGADVDDALLFWLDRGTLPVRLEAAHALGSAGSTRVLGPLRDRAGAWFSDGGVREACKSAHDQIRRRAGGAGNLALAPAGGELSPGDVVVLRREG
jgi:hypothetical protein